LLLSCARNSGQWPRVGVYRGMAVFSFEHSDFTPEGSREKWWLSGAIQQITDRMGGTHADLTNPVLLVVEGELSEPGR
jgi:hypothetical protein